MRARLNVLKEYDAGESSKPIWLEQFELSRMTTEQRAARERQQQREKLLERTWKQQNESKAKREQLLRKMREESQKRKA
jgi:Zn-finger nucleic acid-binding protein